MPGVQLARLFYTEAVRPLLGDRPHAAARVADEIESMVAVA